MPVERADVVGAAKKQMPPEAWLVFQRPHENHAGWHKLAAALGIDPHLGRTWGQGQPSGGT